MNRGDLKTLIRLFVPGAKTNRVSDTILNLLVQMAVDDISANVEPIKEDEQFKITAGDYKYDLSIAVDRFLSIADSGLWWNAGTNASTDWTRLYPRTLKWLDKTRPAWRDLGEGNPRWYTKEGDNLILIPVPNTTLDNGLWLYFNQKPRRMADDSHYPFGYSAQIERLAILDEVIIKYVEWKLKQAIGGKEQEAVVRYQEYERMWRRKKKLLDRRADIQASQAARMQGRKE